MNFFFPIRYLLLLSFFFILLGVGCGNTKGNADQAGKKAFINYEINQTDKRSAKMSIPGSWQGKKSLDFKADVTVKTEGISGVLPGVNGGYDYLTSWEVFYTYDELWEQINLNLGIMGNCVFSDQKIQYKAMLEFDLSQADKNGIFAVTVKSPTANIDSLNMVCTGSYGTQEIPVSAFNKQYATSFTKGKITNMTEAGADIILADSYIYNSGVFKTIDQPIVLKIKKTNQ